MSQRVGESVYQQRNSQVIASVAEVQVTSAHFGVELLSH